MISSHFGTIAIFEARTLTLFCHPAHLTDYYYRRSLAPMIWPWGWEAD